MIPQATPSFWKKLRQLGFLSDSKLQTWQEMAQEPQVSWAQLCARIEQDSILHSAHLNQLAAANGQRIVYGNYLLLRPVFHPLAWTAYQAIHTKLRQPFRLIFLPGTTIQFQRNQETVSLDLLLRARSIAAIGSNEIVKVIDIETFDDQWVAVTQFPETRQMVTLFSDDPFTPQQWINCLQSLADELRMIHASDLIVGGLDPVMMQVDESTGRGRLDFLISSPLIKQAESLTRALTADQQSQLSQYRESESRWVQRCVIASSFSQSHDWQTFGALVDFVAQRFQASAPAVGRQLSLVADSIAKSKEFSEAEISDWQQSLRCENEIAASQVNAQGNLLQTQVGPNATADFAFAAANATPDAPAAIESKAVEAKPKQRQPNARVGSPSIAQRRDLAHQKAQRQRKIVLLAILAPLPLIMIGVAVFFALRPTVDQVPETTAVQDRGDLPDAPLTTNEKSVDASDNPSPASERKGQADREQALAQELASSPPSNSTHGNSPSTAPDPLVSKNIDPTQRSADVESELLADLSSTTHLDANELESTSSSDSDTEQTEMSLADLTQQMSQTLPGALPDSPVDAAGEEVASVGNKDLPATENEAPKSDDANESETEFIEYKNLPETFALRQAIEDAIAGGTAETDTSAIRSTDKLKSSVDKAASGPWPPSLTIDLFALNSVTARNTQVAWKSFSASDALTLLPEEKSSAEKSSAEKSWQRRWAIERLYESQKQKLGYLQITSANTVQFEWLPAAAEAIGPLSRSELSFYYQDESLGHQISFASVRQVPPLEVGKRGGTKVIVWDTPELEGQSLGLQLMFDGKAMSEVPADDPRLKPLNIKRGERLFYLGDAFDLGAVTATVKFSPGATTRFQAQFHFATPNGLMPLTKGAAAELAEQASLAKTQAAAMIAAMKSVRAKPGEGDAKAQAISRQEAEINGADMLVKSLEFAIAKGDSILEQGVVVELRLAAGTARDPAVVADAEQTASESGASELGPVVLRTMPSEKPATDNSLLPDKRDPAAKD